jgi:3-deoxy-7-phosphoheptulonate synthase/chorismate mutase
LSPTNAAPLTLQHYREQLDLLNAQLLHLLELRGNVVLQVMDLKRHQQLPTHDPTREQAMLTSLSRQSRGPYSPAHIELIFGAIFAASRALAEVSSASEALAVPPVGEVADAP